MRLLQESQKIGFFGIFGSFGFGFFGFFGFGLFGFLALVFLLFGSPSRSRGNNYAFLSVLMLIVPLHQWQLASHWALAHSQISGGVGVSSAPSPRSFPLFKFQASAPVSAVVSSAIGAAHASACQAVASEDGLTTSPADGPAFKASDCCSASSAGGTLGSAS